MIRLRFLVVIACAGCAATAASWGYGQDTKKDPFPPYPEVVIPSTPKGHDSPCGEAVVRTPAPCGDCGVRRIVVELAQPEIIIQHAGGVCAPETRKAFSLCGHFRMHQWTHVSYPMHGGAQAGFASPQAMMVSPQAFSVAPQAFSVAPQAFSVAPQAFNVAPQAFSVAPQAFNVAPQAFSISPQAFNVAPQAFNVAPQAFNVAPQGMFVVNPQAGVTPQAGSSDGMDITAAVKKLSENMKTASELLKTQAQILQAQDKRIDTIEASLADAQDLLKAVKGMDVSVDPTNNYLKVTPKKK